MAASLTLSWPKCLEMPPQCLCVSVPTANTHMCVLIMISVGMINCTILWGMFLELHVGVALLLHIDSYPGVFQT